MENQKFFKVEVEVSSQHTLRIDLTANSRYYFFVNKEREFSYDLEEIQEGAVSDLKKMLSIVKDWGILDINVKSGYTYGSSVTLIDSYRALKEHRWDSEYKISEWDGYGFSWDNEPVRKNKKPLFTLLSMCIQKAYELYEEETPSL